MGNWISPEKVLEIVEKMPLIDYLNTFYPYIKFKISGYVKKSCCPFHEEDSASFTIWKTYRYKCFGCGETGNVISFVMKKENLSFQEACVMIAENVGVECVLEPPNPYYEEYKKTMTDHARRYCGNLQTNSDALSYLKTKRGLTDETIKKFRLGLVPEYENNNRSDLGGLSGRISFPILENKDIRSAKCIGMGYRTLKDVGPKYMNDRNQVGAPEEPATETTKYRPAQNINYKGVFIKGNCLYGYAFAYQAIRDSNYAIVVEGYMDTISLHQSNINNVVSCSGIELTEFQMDTLFRLTKNLTFFLDGDKAGIDSMIKKLPALILKGFNVMVIIAEGGRDPGDVCMKLKFDENKIKAYLFKQSRPAMNVIIDRAVSRYEQIVPIERIKAMEELEPFLKIISSSTQREVYKDIMCKRLDMTRA